MERKRLVFQSLQRSDVRYVLSEDSMEFWDSRRDGIAPWAGEYRTYGDGDCHHSPAIGCGRGAFGDYLASLAAHALAVNDPDTYYSIARHWPDVPADDRIVAMSAALRYREGKTRYWAYAQDSRGVVVSSADGKRFDRRWTEVDSHYDGSARHIASLLTREYASLIDSYAIYDACRIAIGRMPDESYDELPANVFNLTDSRGYTHAVDNAFRAAELAARVGRAMDSLDGALQCYRNNAGLNTTTTPEQSAA